MTLEKCNPEAVVTYLTPKNSPQGEVSSPPTAKTMVLQIRQLSLWQYLGLLVQAFALGNRLVGLFVLICHPRLWRRDEMTYWNTTLEKHTEKDVDDPPPLYDEAFENSRCLLQSRQYGPSYEDHSSDKPDA
jgi:hypothetical protein